MRCINLYFTYLLTPLVQGQGRLTDKEPVLCIHRSSVPGQMEEECHKGTS